MAGGKRGSAMKKNVLIVGLIGAETPEGVLHRIVHPESVDHGLGSQNARLAHALIVRHMSPDVGGAGHSNRGGDAHIRRLLPGAEVTQAHRVGAGGIGDHESRRDASRRHQPFGISGLQMKGTGPDVLLVFRQMDQEPGLVGVGDGGVERIGRRSCRGRGSSLRGSRWWCRASNLCGRRLQRRLLRRDGKTDSKDQGHAGGNQQRFDSCQSRLAPAVLLGSVHCAG